MNLRLHPCSVAPAEGPQKRGPSCPTRNGSSCNNATTHSHAGSVVRRIDRVDPPFNHGLLDEFEFRYNNRKTPYLFRDTLRQLVASEHVEYKKLTA